MISAGDNGLMESWDNGFSWSMDKRPGSYAGSRSNAAAYTTVDGVTWALAHVATGFGADSRNGTLYAKRLSDPPSKADRWIAIAGGASERAGLPFQKYNPIVPDPTDPRRIYLASVWNPAKGSGHIHMTDDIT